MNTNNAGDIKHERRVKMALNSENLVFIIHLTHDTIRRREDELFGQHGLTTEQYSILAAIKHLDEPVRITDIAHRVTRSTNSISMIVDRMVKAGLVKRTRDRKDRRTVFVTMTSKAETLFEPATLAGQEFIQKILSKVSHEDTQTLTRLFETLQNEVGAYS